MKKLILLLSVVFIATGIGATDPPQSSNYQYRVDLVNIVDDKVQVELVVPRQTKNEAIFHMPKIIPGTYTISDFGRFISDFNAFDKQGNALPVERQNTNSWKIGEAVLLYKITYLVDDTYDATGDNPVSGMSGTNIEKGKNVLLNAHGFFGYLEGQKYVQFDVHVDRPDDFVASSAYTNMNSTLKSDEFLAADYPFLVDMPIMYCIPDTSIVRLGETEILISVYSPNGLITSSFLKEKFEILLKSQSDYLGGELPVERYAFIMYFMGEQLPIMTGALEHNYSSVYSLPELPQERLAPFLVDIASHEFFHIITPLNIHSEEIHYFDFANPDMSRHLWMYEGVTEYFSHHNQVRSGMITDQEFLDRMGQKVQNSLADFNDSLSFTKLSKECLGEYESEYGNVYEKGALIAMCIDIELLSLSDGLYGIVDMMHDLTAKFGSEQPFKDKKLFKDIKKITYKDVAKFLKVYVDGDTPIPYGDFLSKVGVKYIAPEETSVFTLGGIQVGYNRETNRFVVNNTYGMNDMGEALGYHNGDEVITLNGQSIPLENTNQFFQGFMDNLVVGEILEVKVARKDEAGTEHEKVLKAKIQKVKRMSPPKLSIDEDAAMEEVTLRQAWLGQK
jgi:predicted metalloprotease with PDZ domain